MTTGPMLQRKCLVLISVKHRQNFVSVCFIMVIVIIYLLTKKIYKFKTNFESVDFPTHLCLGIYLNNMLSLKKYHFKKNVYDLSVDCNVGKIWSYISI